LRGLWIGINRLSGRRSPRQITDIDRSDCCLIGRLKLHEQSGQDSI
jgi:hypothetical protein